MVGCSFLWEGLVNIVSSRDNFNDWSTFRERGTHWVLFTGK